MLLKKTSNIGNLLSGALENKLDTVYINIDVDLYLLKTRFPNRKPLYYDNQLPKFCAQYRLFTIKHPDLMHRFDAFMVSHQKDILPIKKSFQFLHSSETILSASQP